MIPRSRQPIARLRFALPPMAGIAQGILGASGMYFMAQLSAKGLNFLFFILLTHWLSVAHFGLLTLAMTVALLVDILADLGMSRLLLRETARRPLAASKRLGLVLPLKACLATAICVPIMVLVLVWRAEGPAFELFSIVSLSMLLAGAALLSEQVLHALGRFGASSIAHVALSLVQLGSAVSIHAAGGGTVAIACSLFLANAAYFAVILIGLYRAGVRPVPRLVPRLWGGVLRRATPYAVVGVLVILMQKVELLMLGKLADPGALGQFGAATRIFDAAMIAPMTICAVLTPRLVAAQMVSPREVTRLYGQGARAMMLVGLLTALVGATLSHPLVSWLLPPEYATSGDILQVMSIGYPLLCLSFLNVSLMLGLGSQKRPALMMVALVCAQIVIAVIGIRAAGAIGAAWAMVASACLSGFVTSIAARAWILDQFVLFSAALPALAAVGSAAVIYAGLAYLGAPWPFVISIVSFAVVATAAALLLPITHTHSKALE